MQSANSTRYKGAIDCAVTVLREEGAARFWKGTTPRLTRLILSGGIVFTVSAATLVLMLASLLTMALGFAGTRSYAGLYAHV